MSGSLDLVFSALPHKASAEACIPVLEQGVKVVDISADFRLKQADEYEEWYGVAHQDPTYLEEAVYGLTELHREDLKAARLVANPGCYPTSAILGLAQRWPMVLSPKTSSWTANPVCQAEAGA